MSPEAHRTPVYEQIAESVRARILSGELADGDPVPSMQEIQDDWGVAQMTAQRAIQVIEQEGLVLTRPGLSTVVAKAETVKAPAIVAEALGVPSGTPVRMQSANGAVIFRLP